MHPLDFITFKTQYGEQIKVLAAKYHIENVRVFGSVARGEAGPDSDVDLLIHGLSNCKPISFEKEVQQLLGNIKVDVVDDEALNRLLAPYILKDATPL